MNNQNPDHPLKREGISQTERTLAALSTSFAPLDERSEAELLEYVWNMAREVIYHEVQDGAFWKGDWLDFFRFSLPIQLSLIGNFNIEGRRQTYGNCLT